MGRAGVARSAGFSRVFSIWWSETGGMMKNVSRFSVLGQRRWLLAAAAAVKEAHLSVAAGGCQPGSGFAALLRMSPSRFSRAGSERSGQSSVNVQPLGNSL